jgi:hypothetical protein
MDKLLSLYSTGKLKGVWVTATLTKPLNNLTEKYLYLFNQIPYEKVDQAGFFICTSWDYKGRFYSNFHVTNWENNMKLISEKYPNINKSTAIILTEDFLKWYLAGFNFRLADFSKRFSTSIFLKQPCEIDAQGYTLEPREVPTPINKVAFNTSAGFGFYPTRDTTLKFMYRLAQDEPVYLSDLFNISKRANDLVKCWGDGDPYVEHRYVEGEVEISGIVQINSCGHTNSYKSYSDSDACIRCDRNAVYEATTGDKFVG